MKIEDRKDLPIRFYDCPGIDKEEDRTMTLDVLEAVINGHVKGDSKVHVLRCHTCVKELDLGLHEIFQKSHSSFVDIFCSLVEFFEIEILLFIYNKYTLSTSCFALYRNQEKMDFAYSYQHLVIHFTVCHKKINSKNETVNYLFFFFLNHLF